MEEEETVWEYLARKRNEEFLPMWEDLMESEREKDREMLRHIKAVEAKHQEKLRKRRERYATTKRRPKD